MKFFPLILYILICIINSNKSNKEDSDLKSRDKNKYDEFYYSRKMKKEINKLGFSKNKLIDKEDFKKVFINSMEKSLEDFNYYSHKIKEKEDNMNNLLNQVYYKLFEKEKDEINMEKALKKCDPNKILNAAEDLMTKLGYPNLVEEITNEVLEEDNKDNIKKNNKDYNNDL